MQGMRLIGCLFAQLVSSVASLLASIMVGEMACPHTHAERRSISMHAKFTGNKRETSGEIKQKQQQNCKVT